MWGLQSVKVTSFWFNGRGELITALVGTHEPRRRGKKMGEINS